MPYSLAGTSVQCVGDMCLAPDNEIDAGHPRIEEDDAIDNEGHGLPKCIKGAVSLYLKGNVPLVGGSPPQPIHSHSNHPCKRNCSLAHLMSLPAICH